MADMKHVGKLKTTGRKVLIVFRSLPGDAYNCLVVPTENLPDNMHDSMIQLVESPAAQNAYEFGEVMARAKFQDGSTMLPALHTQRKMLKVPTDQVIMTPNFTSSVLLSELNQIIAEQRGVAVDDLALKNPVKQVEGVEVVEVAKIKDISPASKTTSGSVNEESQPVVASEPPPAPLSPADQAKQFRSEADRLSKQAADMRRKAEELAPTKKKTKEVVSE